MKYPSDLNYTPVNGFILFINVGHNITKLKKLTMIKNLKKSLFTIILLVGMNSIGHAQCKIENLGEGVLSTSTALLGDGNSSSLCSIIKRDSSFFLKIEYARGLSHDMKINESTPLIFVFKDASKIIIYPVSEEFSDASFSISFKYSFTGTKEIIPVYSITKEQLSILAVKIPEDIKLYYLTNEKPRHKDSTGNYWSILKFQWHYEKRFVKILKCALEQL